MNKLLCMLFFGCALLAQAANEPRKVILKAKLRVYPKPRAALDIFVDVSGDREQEPKGKFGPKRLPVELDGGYVLRGSIDIPGDVKTLHLEFNQRDIKTQYTFAPKKDWDEPVAETIDLQTIYVEDRGSAYKINIDDANKSLRQSPEKAAAALNRAQLYADTAEQKLEIARAEARLATVRAVPKAQVYAAFTKNAPELIFDELEESQKDAYWRERFDHFSRAARSLTSNKGSIPLSQRIKASPEAEKEWAKFVVDFSASYDHKIGDPLSFKAARTDTQVQRVAGLLPK